MLFEYCADLLKLKSERSEKRTKIGSKAQSNRQERPNGSKAGSRKVCFLQTCNTFQKKLGQDQFRASNEVNWLNNDVI